MKSICALLCTMFVPGCGTVGTASKYSGPTYVEPELRPIMEEWAKDCRQHLDSAKCDTAGIRSITRVEKYEDNPNTLGQCTVRWKGLEEVRDITIKRQVPLDGYFVRAIMLHEMLHCRLGFERHEDVGLMGEEMMYGEEELGDKWAELLRETYGLVK